MCSALRVACVLIGLIFASSSTAVAEEARPGVWDQVRIALSLADEILVYVAGKSMLMLGSRCRESDHDALVRISVNLVGIAEIFREEWNSLRVSRGMSTISQGQALRTLENAVFDGLKNYDGSTTEERISAWLNEDGCGQVMIPSPMFKDFADLWSNELSHDELRQYISKFNTLN